MEKTISRVNRRNGVLLNYASLAASAALFCTGEYGGWGAGLVVAALASLAVLVATFYATFVRTRLWRLTHTKTANLDERELHVTHESLRFSYAIFTAVSLVLVTVLHFAVRFSVDLLTFRGHNSVGLAMLIFLYYLSRTMPAAVIAWREKAIIIELP